MYFDAERYKDATQWYEAALKLDPNNADISTDLGVGYYYLNEPDRALAQFDRSLQIDSKHTKTLLNVGIVRAFGKQDLAGAAKAWEQVLALAPASPEGQAARRALDAMKGAHPNLPAGATPATPRPGPTEGPRHGIPPARGSLLILIAVLRDRRPVSRGRHRGRYGRQSRPRRTARWPGTW